MSTSSPLELGVVVGAHGLRGQVRVKLFARDSTSLEQAGRVFVSDREGRETEHAIQSLGQGSKGHLILGLSGVRDRTAAEALVGARVLVGRADLPPLAPEEFYLVDAVGCEAVDERGAPLGRVVAVDDNGAHGLLTLRSARLEVSVPATGPFVKAFDGSVLVLLLPEGFLEALGSPVEPSA